MAEKRDSEIVVLARPLRFLCACQISQIDACLADLGEFGRVTLVKEKGKLRFVEKVESLAAVRPIELDV